MERIAERGKSIGDTTGTRVPHAIDTRIAAGSTKRLWAGRIMSGLAMLFLAFDGVIKVLKLAPAVEGTIQLGYPASVVFGLGIVQLVCLIIYVIPRTAVLGAILWTGYLGGAIATHVRIGNPLFTHTLFPIYVAVLVWGGLYLRDERLRAVIPLRRRD
jgi:DoxX-like protein